MMYWFGEKQEGGNPYKIGASGTIHITNRHLELRSLLLETPTMCPLLVSYSEVWR
jgi:hypothetical protein